MRELIRKELKGFFASLSGYVVLCFFLVANGLFLWVIPGMYNIPGSGLADLQPFFSLAPVLYLFLVPVLCMRLFAEEKRTGTLELLLTRPVSVSRIVTAKYLSGFLLVLFSILPTLIYPVSLWFLAQPEGHIDVGGIMGSYIGLVFLSGMYVAASVWASSVTDNQIVAFLYGLVLSFLLLSGFDFLSDLPVLHEFQNFILKLGVNYHYEPMSRGVIALEDVTYFLTVIAFFIWLTVRKYHGARKWKAVYVLPALLLLNIAAVHLYIRADITDDKRYTLSENTRQLLKNLDRGIGVDIFLAGNLPPGMQKLQYATTRMLEEFRRITGNKLRYSVTNPAEIQDKEEQKQLVRYLAERGIMPVNLSRTTEDETLSQQFIFPGLLVYDDSTEVSLSLLQNVPGYAAEENINHSVEALEYELTKALRLLTRKEKKAVAFLTGHGELPYKEVEDIARTLAYYYRVDFVSPDTLAADLSYYRALIVAGPTTEFPEKDKYILDQYVMNGGRILWCIDEVDVNHDVLKERETTYAMYRPLNIEDLLFKYGVRINPDILLDGNCVLVPVVTGMHGNTPEYSPAPWYFSPLLIPQRNAVTAGIQPVRVDYANTIDTVGGKEGLKKSVLLASSRYAAAMKTPCPVSLSITEEKMTEDRFNKRYLPVAVMLEGCFESVYRYGRRFGDAVKAEFKPESGYNRMIVIADADVLRNKVYGAGENACTIPLGYDEYSGRVYGNRDFILNCINTLCDDEGWMSLRGRNLSLYLLDKTRLKGERTYWEMLNLLLPLGLVLMGGGIFWFVRKRKYGRA